jgi:hypothetical protein
MLSDLPVHIQGVKEDFASAAGAQRKRTVRSIGPFTVFILIFPPRATSINCKSSCWAQGPQETTAENLTISGKPALSLQEMATIAKNVATVNAMRDIWTSWKNLLFLFGWWHSPSTINSCMQSKMRNEKKRGWRGAWSNRNSQTSIKWF